MYVSEARVAKFKSASCRLSIFVVGCACERVPISNLRVGTRKSFQRFLSPTVGFFPLSRSSRGVSVTEMLASMQGGDCCAMFVSLVDVVCGWSSVRY